MMCELSFEDTCVLFFCFLREPQCHKQSTNHGFKWKNKQSVVSKCCLKVLSQSVVCVSFPQSAQDYGNLKVPSQSAKV